VEYPQHGQEMKSCKVASAMKSAERVRAMNNQALQLCVAIYRRNQTLSVRFWLGFDPGEALPFVEGQQVGD
jgi:hypothetical protein